jgi:predicted metalloprotease
MRLADRLTLGLGAILAVLFGGCGSGTSDEPEGRSSPSGEPASRLPAIENNGVGSADYRAVVDEALGLLDIYWTDQLQAEGEPSDPPDALVAYSNRSQDKGCGGRRAGAFNAQYCSLNDTISWDTRWLFGELYRYAGDAAVAFLLAHEYGHLVQNRLGVEEEFRATIEAELNADCLAGAWFGAVDERVARLDDRDFAELYAAVLDVADAKGLPWQDPSAHGTASQRGNALLFGAEHDPRACFRRYGPGFTR